MESLIDKYKEIFGEHPKIIGLFWDDNNIVVANIKKAIKDNIPYNEYELLSKEEKKAFNDGVLLF